MDRRKITLLSVMIAMIILFAFFSSFGNVWFSNNNTIPVLWPSPAQNTAPNGETPSVDTTEVFAHGYQRIQLTPENVQSVVATLSRPEAYTQTILLHLYWGNGADSSVSIQGCTDGAYSAAKIVQGVQIQYNIWGNDTLYRWYQGDQNWYQGKISFMNGDLLQRIPTYETILSLEKKRILSASYTRLGQTACIYVEASENKDGAYTCYWVDAVQGLLLRAEAYEGEQMIWCVEVSDLTLSIPGETLFLLPDGTDVRTRS